MTTLSLQTAVRNAAAVFSGCYGAVTRRAEQAGCSRQTVYQHARELVRRLQPPIPTSSPRQTTCPAPTAVLDEHTRRRLALTAFAMGISTRQIEDLLGILQPEDGPDHSTIARWVAEEARKAKGVLKVLDEACIPEVRTLAVDEIFFGGGRPWWGSSRPA